MKPYVAKTISGAQRRVRELLRQRAERDKLLEQYARERKLLAMLAAEGPAFWQPNPLHVYEARRIRDEILAQMGMEPNGNRV